ncbi:hypothetical protein I302_100051 [Kwoniella bestiolae CBS 10118]|uniref:Uncharacterized protein n=1 Tax=Kwoniella bestiolae CBS 10118 TaxID=1296100 RepID=A0A1B9G431_9TREE|nr:hypothetical protein I302_03423 [Kwoniella bestiolae CBS 10118]OCF25750.1 hypothetical protein I302_03423 [Kwoniella bestiolae CBS 10118]
MVIVRDHLGDPDHSKFCSISEEEFKVWDKVLEIKYRTAEQIQAISTIREEVLSESQACLPPRGRSIMRTIDSTKCDFYRRSRKDLFKIMQTSPDQECQTDKPISLLRKGLAQIKKIRSEVAEEVDVIDAVCAETDRVNSIIRGQRSAREIIDDHENYEIFRAWYDDDERFAEITKFLEDFSHLEDQPPLTNCPHEVRSFLRNIANRDWSTFEPAQAIVYEIDRQLDCTAT